jgi:hypothetical protein
MAGSNVTLCCGDSHIGECEMASTLQPHASFLLLHITAYSVGAKEWSRPSINVKKKKKKLGAIFLFCFIFGSVFMERLNFV